MSRLGVLILAMCVSSSAFATGPVLSELPQSPTLESCGVWAGKQDPDAIFMYGQKEDGGSSNDLGLSRLTSSCMGDRPPDIVNFGTSAVFDERFCRAHPSYGICHPAEPARSSAICVVDDPTPTPLNFRTGPYGRVLGSFQNGMRVEILDRTVDRSGKPWVYVASEDGRPFGWVYRDYVRCE